MDSEVLCAIYEEGRPEVNYTIIDIPPGEGIKGRCIPPLIRINTDL
jgi:hypothetical protein